VEIGTKSPIFLFWEYLFQIFGILSLPFELIMLLICQIEKIQFTLNTDQQSFQINAQFVKCPVILVLTPELFFKRYNQESFCESVNYNKQVTQICFFTPV
jgi:hypothetical protein